MSIPVNDRMADMASGPFRATSGKSIHRVARNSIRRSNFRYLTVVEASIIRLSQIIENKRGRLTVRVFIRAMHGHAITLGAKDRGQKVPISLGATGIYTCHDLFKPLVCCQPFAGGEQSNKRHFSIRARMNCCEPNQA